MEMNIKDIKVISPDEVILKCLQREKLPISITQLKYKIESKMHTAISILTIKDYIKVLRKRGYDVKEIRVKGTPFYLLVRYGKLMAEDYYKPVAKIETPIMLTGDWHIGSKGFSALGYRELVSDIDKHNIRDVIHCGDILQGLGVYTEEREDLSMYSIDEQVEATVDMLRELPSKTKVHLIMGNHERKIQARHKQGFDACDAIAKEVKSVNYYHNVAILSLNKQFKLMMMHGKGGSSYAASYNLEKVFRNLTERPDILAMGHWHEMDLIEKPPNYKLFKVGTLQRESIYILRMGLTAQVGWYILKNYSAESASIESRYPKVY